MNDPNRGTRFSGQGSYAEHLARTFKVFAKKLGLDRSLPPFDRSLFRPPRPDTGQLRLF